MGCPKNADKAVSDLGPYQVPDLQLQAATNLYEELRDFCRVKSEEGWSRGRKTLHEAINSLVARELIPGSSCKPPEASAKAVDPARISLPERAAVCKPEDFLCKERRAVLKDLRSIILPERGWPHPLPQPCHWITRADEVRLRASLLRSGMAEVISADRVPRDSRGRRIVAGLFTVPHKVESDRLIIDRRPQNATESRLMWSELPHGSLLGQIRLSPKSHLRGSGDDLSNYFYLLENPPNWRPRCAFGRAFSGPEASALGLEPRKKYYLALRAWAMGDLDSVDVAQSCHEGVLRSNGGLASSDHLRYGYPLPRSSTLQGVYIDDHLLLGIVPKSRAKDSAANRDMSLLELSRKAYEAANLARAPKKAFEKELNFTAWGTEVRSEAGQAGAPRERRLQLLMLTFLALSSRLATKELIRSLLGSFVHPFGHRKYVKPRRRRFAANFGFEPAAENPAGPSGPSAWEATLPAFPSLAPGPQSS